MKNDFFIFSAKNKTLTPGQAEIVNYLDYHKGKISQAERMKLLKAMQTLCEGIDIIEIEQIQVTNEEFLNRSVSPFMNQTLDSSIGQRFKRSTFAFCNASQA